MKSATNLAMKTKIKTKTIRQRLTRRLFWSIVTILACLGVGVYMNARRALLSEFDWRLQTKAATIAALVQYKDGIITVENPERYILELDKRALEYDKHAAMDYFQIRLRGQTVIRSETLGDSDLPEIFWEKKRWLGWAPSIRNLTLPNGRPGRVIKFSDSYFPPDNKGVLAAKVGEGISITYASDLRGLREEELIFPAVLLALYGAFLLWWLAWAFSRQLKKELQPLEKLADQAESITADSLSLSEARFPVDGLPGELTQISERLNDLLERLNVSFDQLERSIARERQFSADLAHELRTPIAELRGFAELALKLPHARTEANDREVFAIALQMENLVNVLLAMHRGERGGIVVASEPVAIAELLAGAWKPFARKADGKRLDYSCTIPADAVIRTDAALLRSILTNLLDNAVEYTPAGGIVRVEWTADAEARVKDARAGGRFELRIANTVANLDADDVTKLFDRFWRKDPARSGNEHSGLGLSLARAYARVLGFEIDAELEGGGSRLAVILSGPAS